MRRAPRHVAVGRPLSARGRCDLWAHAGKHAPRAQPGARAARNATLKDLNATVAQEPAPDGAPAAHRSAVSAKAPAARYTVLERLASGGMGTVYRVLDRVAGEERVLKRVRVDGSDENPGSARSLYFVAAFEREYQVLRTLDHPRIIRVFDYGIDEEGPFYTMELLDGQDMRGMAPMPYRTACSCLRDVATSLVLLHARRLVHRDLSPGNVRITSDGRCKL